MGGRGGLEVGSGLSLLQRVGRMGWKNVCYLNLKLLIVLTNGRVT